MLNKTIKKATKTRLQGQRVTWRRGDKVTVFWFLQYSQMSVDGSRLGRHSWNCWASVLIWLLPGCVVVGRSWAVGAGSTLRARLGRSWTQRAYSPALWPCPLGSATVPEAGRFLRRPCSQTHSVHLVKSSLAGACTAQLSSQCLQIAWLIVHPECSPPAHPHLSHHCVWLTEDTEMFVNDWNTGRQHSAVRSGCLNKISDKVHISFFVDFLKSGQEEKGVAEDEMVGWHHQLNGHEFEQTPGGQWRTGKPGVLHSMGLQRVGHHLVTEQQQWSLLMWPLAKPLGYYLELLSLGQGHSPLQRANGPMGHLVPGHQIAAVGETARSLGPFPCGHSSNISTEWMSHFSLNTAQDGGPAASYSCPFLSWGHLGMLKSTL